jgi:hypothetical protein
MSRKQVNVNELRPSLSSLLLSSRAIHFDHPPAICSRQMREYVMSRYGPFAPAILLTVHLAFTGLPKTRYSTREQSRILRFPVFSLRIYVTLALSLFSVSGALQALILFSGHLRVTM